MIITQAKMVTIVSAVIVRDPSFRETAGTTDVKDVVLAPNISSATF